MIYLPNILNHKNRISRIWIFTVITFLLYFSAAHFSPFSPNYLPLTWLDKQLPLIPWTIWVYVSLYPLCILGFLLYENERNLSKQAWLFLLTQVIAFFIFLFWPTIYPRDIFSATPHSSFMLDWIWRVDKPLNCCPSLHVANCFLISFGFLPENHRRLFWFLLFSVVISLSTLTTKQHYAIDVLCGFLFACLIYFGLGKFIGVSHE